MRNLKTYRKKTRQTNLEKYGVEYPFQSKEVQEKMKQTNLEKYGVENILQVKEVRDKIFQTQRIKQWKIFRFLLKEKDIAPLFTKEEYMNVGTQQTRLKKETNTKINSAKKVIFAY